MAIVRNQGRKLKSKGKFYDGYYWHTYKTERRTKVQYLQCSRKRQKHCGAKGTLKMAMVDGQLQPTFKAMKETFHSHAKKPSLQELTKFQKQIDEPYFLGIMAYNMTELLEDLLHNLKMVVGLYEAVQPLGMGVPVEKVPARKPAAESNRVYERHGNKRKRSN